ncbi:MAG: hypothetical protein U0746_10135 [Gemmataceae bacterium]
MTRRLIAIAAIAACGLAGVLYLLWPVDPPPLRLPPEVTGRPGRLVAVTAQTPAPLVRWHTCAGPSVADLWPTPDGKTVVFCAPQPGRYTLYAWAAAGSRPTEAVACVVRLEEPTPPPPPEPPDPFAAALRAAWDGEASPERGRQRDALAGFYRVAATVATQSSSATVGDLYAALQREIAGRLAGDALPRVRAVLAAEFRAKLPTNPAAPLDAATRELCRAQFERAARALDALR